MGWIMMLSEKRILVTGPTSQAARAITCALALDNETIGVARFTDPDARSILERSGVVCVEADLTSGDLTGVPTDVDFVLHFAVGRSSDWDLDISSNAEAVGLLMSHCRRATAFLHCSSTAVYHPAGTHPIAETDPLGENHREFMPTYSISKIAAEAVVRTEARQLGLPTTIARLNVPYSDTGGWPAWHLECVLGGFPIQVHPDRPNLFNPIHSDDMLAMIPRLLEVASIPATIINWGGDQQVDLETWCTYLGTLVGREPVFETTTNTVCGVTTDNSRRLELIGPTAVDWRDGMRAMATTLHPEAIVGT